MEKTQYHWFGTNHERDRWELAKRRAEDPLQTVGTVASVEQAPGHNWTWRTYDDHGDEYTHGVEDSLGEAMRQATDAAGLDPITMRPADDGEAGDE